MKDSFWKYELSLAQALWVLEVENLGPFLVECDTQGRSLFGLANAEVNETCQRLYEGLPQPALKRLGEVTSPTEDVLEAHATGRNPPLPPGEGWGEGSRT